MKIRESGMPEQDVWETFFDIDQIFEALLIHKNITHLVEIGSGYGTFTLPAAKKISGQVLGFDIEEDSISTLKQKVLESNITNIKLNCRDITTHGTGLKKACCDYVMLFNIMHHSQPLELLNEAKRILIPGGYLGILHWRSDIPTPRGPSLEIRPSANQLLKLIDYKQFNLRVEPLNIPPYHYGFVLQKRD